jgi:hypothetical protein
VRSLYTPAHMLKIGYDNGFYCWYQIGLALPHAVLYNKAMDQDIIKDRNDNLSGNGDLVKLEALANNIMESLTAHKQYLEKHTAAMEKLTQAIKQLDQTLKKEINLESHRTSNQVEELIKLFVEYEINPEFYHEHKALKAAVVSNNTQIVKYKPAHKVRR